MCCATTMIGGDERGGGINDRWICRREGCLRVVCCGCHTCERMFAEGVLYERLLCETRDVQEVIVSHKDE